MIREMECGCEASIDFPGDPVSFRGIVSKCEKHKEMTGNQIIREELDKFTRFLLKCEDDYYNTPAHIEKTSKRKVKVRKL